MRKLIVWLLTIVLLAARGAAAADYVTPTLVYGGAHAADYWSSVHALRRGGVEVGPLAKGNLEATKIGGTLALVAIDVTLQKKGRKREAWILRGAVLVGYALVIKSNHSKARP